VEDTGEAPQDTAPPPSYNRPGNKATSNVLAILSAFIDRSEPLRVSELSRLLGMTNSMVSRGLASLTSQNYVVRDPTGTKYQLGYALAEFGGLTVTAPDLHEMCRPFMHRLRDVTGATISLLVPVRDHAVCVDGLVGPGDVARRVPLGEAFPLHVTPGARVILACLPDEEIERYIAGRAPNRDVYRPRATEEIWADVHDVRANGYAEDRGDYVPQTVATALAFPVLDINGEPHGSLTAAGSAGVFTRPKIRELLDTARRVVQQLDQISRLYSSTREPVS
jgi:IclR family transcriptional regulator, KDG regulon repressor